jgi:VanZ family protein
MIDLPPQMRRAAALGAWGALVLLALLSLLPKSEMVRTGAAGWFEHVVAYAGTMTLFAIGHARRFGLMRPALALGLYAVVLELAQHVAPGRSPQLRDALAGIAGLSLAVIGAALWRRWRSSGSPEP